MDALNDDKHFLNIFFHFMQYGSLPWNVPHMSLVQFEEKAEKALLQEPAIFLQHLLRFLDSAGQEEIRRLVYQLTAHMLEKLTGILLTFYSIHVHAYRELKNIFQLHFKSVMRDEISKQVLYVPVLLLLKKGYGIKEDFAMQYTSRVMVWLVNIYPGSSKSEELLQELVQVNEHIKDHINELLFFQKEEDTATLPATKKYEPVQHDALYIYNAGLVLLHPYLFVLFRNLQLVNDEQQFIDEPSRCTAILLTQYLVTGDRNIPEYELLLNKVLCGTDIYEPVTNTIDTDESVFAEADDLLQQVNDMWQMKGVVINNSMENLRASFLQRPGKLTRNDTGWVLQVEQRSYDIVLSSLSWGISVIKNELMQDMLYVEWA